MFKMVDGKKVPMTDAEIAARAAEEAAEAAKPPVERPAPVRQVLADLIERVAALEAAVK